MLKRRTFICSSVAAAALTTSLSALAATGAKLVLVHGRSQEGRKPEEILDEWLGALKKGVEANGAVLPTALNVRLPYFGDMLEKFAKQLEIPVLEGIKTKGNADTQEFLRFQAEVAEEVRIAAGVTEKQVNDEYGNNTKEKGPLNWEWVQAIVAAIDKYATGMSTKALEIVTRDVFMYTTYPAIRDAINEVVRAEITEDFTVIVGHSLGSVVAYNVLHSENRTLDVPLFVTVGSPLAIRAIRRRLTPISYPKKVVTWMNAFDKRDVVALFPLDKNNFDVSPSILNFGDVDNHTDNRHGVSGYLNDITVAGWLTKAL